MKNSLFIILLSSLLNAENYAEDAKDFWKMSENPKGRMKAAIIIVIKNKVYAYGIAM
ncbi:hypothetical protein [uncultured Brachyspira sp.]|uniref:hypothetical protein n=1 Tax=uncultured Brachyspira sp. TaxID=221953 RepID=UPI0025E60071|nr:hypothetical protein [uncultured Brachyspira sp.]